MPKREAQMYNKGMPRRKNREFTDVEKTIFLLGVNEGEQRMKYRLELFKTTNSAMRREIERLEAYDPLVYIKLIPDEVKQIAALLKIASKAKDATTYQRKCIRRFVRELDCRLKKALEIEIESGQSVG